jgi:hypothetical protein
MPNISNIIHKFYLITFPTNFLIKRRGRDKPNYLEAEAQLFVNLDSEESVKERWQVLNSGFQDT